MAAPHQLLVVGRPALVARPRHQPLVTRCQPALELYIVQLLVGLAQLVLVGLGQFTLAVVKKRRELVGSTCRPAAVL